MEQNIVLKQTTTVSPQIIQSLEVLQMETQELLEYIEEQTQENPALEVEYKTEKEYDDIAKKMNWLESTDTQNGYYYRSDSNGEAGNNSCLCQKREDEDLRSYLWSQINDIKPGGKLGTVVDLIIDNLDGRGYLKESDSVIADMTGLSEDIVKFAVRKVQSLEPAGVAARNLQECLTIQLKRNKCKNWYAYTIVARFLEEVGKSHYALISKRLSLDVKEVRDICDTIKGLNPSPAIGFSADVRTNYIIPDIIVNNIDGRLEIMSNDTYFPTIRISRYCNELLHNAPEKHVEEYLVDKIKKAKWVIKSIEQRKSTILRCAECILMMQEDFFKRGPRHLVPMSLSDLSEKLDIHESTVSRSLRNKYLQCNFGIFPMKYFFSRAVGDQTRELAPEAIKSVIKEMIDNEDKRKPLSDNRLSERLMDKAINISRRTVAKYREELGIPNSVGRKTYG